MKITTQHADHLLSLVDELNTAFSVVACSNNSYSNRHSRGRVMSYR